MTIIFTQKDNFDSFEWNTGGPQIVRFSRTQGTVLLRTVLIPNWFSTKSVIYAFWILKVPFFANVLTILSN